MTVAMMRIREMRMRVRHALVPVHVRVALARRDRKSVLVLMMLVMRVFVLVLERLVRVSVLMTLREMQPDTGRHQRTSDGKWRRDAVAEHDHRERGARERR